MIFRSPFADVAIPDVSLTEFILSRARTFGDAPALIEGPTGRTMSFAQLVGHVERVASGLTERGFQKGDVLAIFAPNLPEYAVAFLAVASLGGINTTINTLYTPEEILYQLRDAGAQYLVTTPTLLEKAQQAAQNHRLREVFVFGEADGATPFSALLASTGHAPNVHINPAEDLVVLPYSSGTTGFPKGVMLTHRHLVANIAQTRSISNMTPDDRVIGVLPFFHIYGMVVIMGMCLYDGVPIITMPRFDLEQFLETLQRYGITIAYLVPPIILALAKHPLVDKYDLSKLRNITSGAAPLGAEVEQACAERLGVAIQQGYGMTEASPVTHCAPRGAGKPGAVGKCAPLTECVIVDVATGQELGPNQRGEIWVRGPQIMRGYLNRPEETAATVDAGGWLHTGDIGYIEEDGWLYVVDRVKELIKYKGYQVAPAELEALLVSHPAIADAAVIPSPDEEAGEVPKAFIVLKAPASADDILEFVAGHVAPFKRIRKLEFVESIPKSASGKILRRVLIDRERSGVTGDG